jgi:Siphovirus Gp157
MSISLYKANELARLESHIDQDTGEIDVDAFYQSGITLRDKQIATIAYLKNSNAEQLMLDKAIEDLTSRKKALQKSVNKSKSMLAKSMRDHEITSIKANDGTFEAKLCLDRDEAVVIQDGVTFPPELCNAPKPPEPSKTLIKAAINAGQAVAGAVIVRNDRLTIR